MITVQQKIEHITISNVFGSYYHYCIGFKKFYSGETTGSFDAVTLNSIHVSKAKRMPIQEFHMGKDENYHFLCVWIQCETKIKNMFINGLHRRIYENPVATIQIDEKVDVDYLVINDVSVHNHTNAELSVIV